MLANSILSSFLSLCCQQLLELAESGLGQLLPHDGRPLFGRAILRLLLAPLAPRQVSLFQDQVVLEERENNNDHR